MSITYLKGDATVPQAAGPKLIVHIVNTLGGWGAGFVVAISRRWPEPEFEYRVWHRLKQHEAVYGRDKSFKLGHVQVIQVKPDIWICNMLAQQGMREGSKGPPVRYAAVAKSLETVAVLAAEKKASVHMPRIGCGLGGGRWEIIEPLIVETLCDQELPVYVYDI